jgi:hypothetical protein
VWYEYNGKAGLPTNRLYVGVIAQEMQKIAPYTIGEFTYQDSTGNEEKYLDYDANALIYMLVNAVKELQGVTQEQSNLITGLRSQLSEVNKIVGKGVADEGVAAARLLQNYPNPYNTSTIIEYYIPDEVISAAIKIYDVSGQEVYNAELTRRGKGEIEVFSQTFSAGVYVYHLLVDGNRVDNKKMLLDK